MSSETVRDRSEVEEKRLALIKAYVQGEQDKVEEMHRKKNPNLKQKFIQDLKGSLRSIVEKF